jgi:hypothetical protein
MELVLLMSTGDVIRYQIENQTGQILFSVKDGFEYSDGGFDITAQSTIYTLDEIVVVVNDFKLHGYIHYPGNYHSLHLSRGDYHADISCFSIALFKNETGVPHIIYGVAWNHIQIMNLDTRQVLTAAKSLIEVGAEEKHIEFYKNFKGDNKFPWPRPYDYFFGKLHLSPDNKTFLSAGWAWGSSDVYTTYDIDHFIQSNRIAYQYIAFGEHENRAVCWINSNTIAVTYHPYTEGDENAAINAPFEIHYYKTESQETVLDKKVQVGEIDIVHAQLLYDEGKDCFIVYSDKIGTALISREGQTLFHDSQIKIDIRHAESGILLKTEDNTVTMYEVKE